MLKRLLLLLGLAALLGAGYAVAAGMTVSDDRRRPAARAGDRGLGRHGHVRQRRRQGRTRSRSRASASRARRSTPAARSSTSSTAAAATTATARPGGGPNKLGTIVVELKGSVTLKASATTVPWGKSLRLSGKSTFPGTPVNIVERVPGSGTAWAKIGDDRGGGRRLVRASSSSRSAARSIARRSPPTRSRPRTVRVSVQPIAHDPRARAEREGRRSGDDHGAGDAAARGDDARPAAPRRRATAAGSRTCASGPRRTAG